MNIERFNQLLNGPLNHPLIPFVITRLSQALLFVVEQTGEGGEKALEQFCAGAREENDDQEDEWLPDGTLPDDVIPPGETGVSCSWCHTLNQVTEGGQPVVKFCKSCLHRADVPRSQCDCLVCQGGLPPLTDEDIKKALKSLEGGR
jgi:hypothetical protein